MFDENVCERKIRELKSRHPEWFSGGPVVNTVQAPRNASSANSRPLGEQMHKERVEWDRKQATADHNDGEIDERETEEDFK